ncbi:MAG: CHAT domain-containing protein, partial [Acidimicrobiia bacterium]|nr:CHAT domain-containing protein [Acidimicrobiia bacterium]
MVSTHGVEYLIEAISESDATSAFEMLRATGQLDPETSQELLDIAARHVQSDPALAAKALAVCEAAAAEVGPPEVEPAARYLRARLSLNLGEPEHALELIDDAKRGWLALERPLDAWRTELGRMHVLDDLGRHGDSLDGSQALLAELDGFDATPLGPGDRVQLQWLRAASLESLGVAWGLIGEHERALEAYLGAEEVYRQLGKPTDVARSLANCGVELIAVGRAVEGLEVFNSATPMFAEADDRLSYAKCLGHTADAEMLLGRYGVALARFEEARSILDELGARTESCRLQLHTVRAYLALNLVDEAETIAESAAGTLAALGARHDLAEAHWLVAVAKLRVGRPEAALESVEAAIAGSADADDPPLYIKALVTKSEAMAETGNVAGARRVAEQALSATASGAWPTDELHARLGLAQLLDDEPVADDHLQRALALADDLALPHVRYPVLLLLGRLRRRQGRIEEAKLLLADAVEVVEGLRGRLPDEAIRASYLEGRTAAHGELISIYLDPLAGVEGVDLDAAYGLAEASKARTLSDLLTGIVRPSASPQSRAEADLEAVYSTMAAGGVEMTADRRRRVAQRATRLEREVSISKIQTAARNSETLAGSPVSPPTARPGSGDQVVEYQVIGDEIIAFVWSEGRLALAQELSRVDRIVELLAEWDRQRIRAQVGNQVGLAHRGALAASADQVLRDLWLASFRAVEAHLEESAGRTDGGSGPPPLIVVPHGPLHQVPFHALIGDEGPVGRRWSVTLAPSFAVADALRLAPWRPAHGRSLVLGVPDSAAPAVTQEAMFVADAVPGADLLLGYEATADALVANASERDVIHFACHGIHRARNPMFSSLKLADRWLTAREVLSLRLDRSLVVLSACESGRQNGQGALNEAIGLARSFVAAGASAVVVSLWLAGDTVTADLMQTFYGRLAAG